MKNKNQLILVGFMLSFINFSSLTAQASPPSSGPQGEFFTISAEASGRVECFSDGEDYLSVMKASEDNLNEKAFETCQDRKFKIIKSSIEHKSSGGCRTLTTVKTTAIVLCFN